MLPPERRARSECLDLLVPDAVDLEISSTALTVDTQAQLRAMVDLLEHGLMSIDEFERQRRKIAGDRPRQLGYRDR